MSGTTPTLGLGPVEHYTPLSDNTAADPLIGAIQVASQGGQSTVDYFQTINQMGQVFQQLTQGRQAWLDGNDTSPIQAPVKYVAANDVSGNTFYVKVGQEQVTPDGNGNINTNGSSRTINGVTYQGIGMITMECGWTNYTFSKTSWWLGTSLGGFIVASKILPPLFTLIKATANVLADKIKAIFAKQPPGGDPEEQDEEDADSGGDADIAAEEGGNVVIETGAEEGAIALGDVFIGVGIALAIIFITASFVLHNSYHHFRVWNLTTYSLEWTVHFDTSQLEDQGLLVRGPVVFNPDTSIVKTYGTIAPLSHKAPIPGVQPENLCYYGDVDVNSSHEFSGIGYVIQWSLKDASGNTAYTATMYFDVPFGGNNSTDCTMSPQPDLQAYYSANNGKNQNTVATANSDDGVITVTTTYDYLSGEHAVPAEPTAGSGNLEYYYQSVINISQNNLPPAPPADQKTVSDYTAAPKGQGAMQVLNSLTPAMKKCLDKALKRSVAQKPASV